MAKPFPLITEVAHTFVAKHTAMDAMNVYSSNETKIHGLIRLKKEGLRHKLFKMLSSIDNKPSKDRVAQPDLTCSKKYPGQ